MVLVLGALVYLQVREWRKFDWATFKENTADIDLLQIVAGVVLIHAADFFRAIRWKIFLRPTRPNTSWKSLVAPQYVGFAGLALLGRPGELIRPYLVALRANTTVPAQIALWLWSMHLIMARSHSSSLSICSSYRKCVGSTPTCGSSATS